MGRWWVGVVAGGLLVACSSGGTTADPPEATTTTAVASEAERCTEQLQDLFYRSVKLQRGPYDDNFPENGFVDMVFEELGAGPDQRAFLAWQEHPPALRDDEWESTLGDAYTYLARYCQRSYGG